MTRCSNAAIQTDDSTQHNFPLTSGVVAIVNLQAQIDGQERLVEAASIPSLNCQLELIDLVALRGQIMGRISDYEWTQEKAEQVTRNAPTDAVAFVARARARARFHRFADALKDVDEAERLQGDPTVVATERASILQATGRYESALTIYEELAKRRVDFASLGALATLHAERGEVAAAEPLFELSRNRYRGVSPIPLAQLDFQRGLMWLAREELRRAHTWLETAVQLLPAYAPAQGHLGEVEAALGDPNAAIARLLPLTASSDDPDYAAQLARILSESGEGEKAGEWRNKAAARYDELMVRHAEAFADHAAEFWLEAGDDPDRALCLAKMNLEVRQTPRARQLLSRAMQACKDASASAPSHDGDER